VFPPPLLAELLLGLALAPFVARLGWRAALLRPCWARLRAAALLLARVALGPRARIAFGALDATVCAYRLHDLPVTGCS
jgi:hypothetical protein